MYNTDLIKTIKLMVHPGVRQGSAGPTSYYTRRVHQSQVQLKPYTIGGNLRVKAIGIELDIYVGFEYINSKYCLLKVVFVLYAFSSKDMILFTCDHMWTIPNVFLLF